MTIIHKMEKTAKLWPKTNQKPPDRRYRPCAGARETELRDLIRVNKINKLTQRRQSATLSKERARDLIGRKINKGNSCVSVSRKQSHAVNYDRHYQSLNFLKKCYKIRKTEVSHNYKTPVKPHILRLIKIKLSGLGIPPNRVPNKTIESRLPNLDKVRQPLTTDSLKINKKRKVLNREALSGTKMNPKDGNDMPEKDDEERERRKKPPKVHKKESKKTNSKKAKLTKLWNIDPEAFRHELEMACSSLKNRKSKKPLSEKEIKIHLDTISESVRNLAAHRRKKKNSSKTQTPTGKEVRESMEPKGTAPKGTANRGTEGATKPRNKRKRSEIKVKSEPESDSSEPSSKPCKRSKRSTVSETDDSTDSEGSDESEYEESEHEESEEGPELDPQTDPDPLVPTESPITKHRKRKLDIKMGKGSKEKKFRLKQRSNSLFDHEGVNKEGKKYYRRKPPKAGGKPFKPPPDKPGDGGNIKDHPEGKMLKASKIADQQTAGKSIRPYLNGVGYQLRLAEAVRKLVALSLPDVKRTVRYKAKNGNPSRPVVDPRLMYAHLSLRRDKRAMDAFDQWNNKEVGAYPVQEDQRKISYICLGDSSEDETENRKRHPKKWMGKDLKNNKVDGAKSLVSLLTFLMPPSQLGNMKGDEKLLDEDGLLKIPKEEVFSEPETNPQNEESESDDESDDEMDTPDIEGTKETKTGENEAQIGDQTEKERTEPEEGTEEETGEAETKEPDSDSDIEIIDEVTWKPGDPPQIVELEDMETEERMGGIKSKPGSNPRHPTPSTSTGRTSVPTLKAIQTQIQHLSKLLYQQISKTSSNTEMTTPERTKVKKEEPKEEPEDPTPEKEPVSDTDECIQNLQDHLASTQMATESPNPQAPKRTKHPPPNRTLKTNTKKGRMLRMNLTLGVRESRR